MIFTQQEWYTPAEVAVHNKPGDCWISLNGKVMNLTDWVQKQLHRCACLQTCSCANKNWYCQDDCRELCDCFKQGFNYCDARRLVMTILSYAGKDISHWFKGDDWVHYMHPIACIRTTFHQHGPDGLRPVVPSTRWRPYGLPWWLDEGMVIGKASAKTRPIKILNTITGSTVTLEVCSEETIHQIMMRYMPHNAHFHSYTWRYLGNKVCYNKTLEENGVLDERELFSEVALPENVHIPCLLVYYNDDLTEDPKTEHCFCTDLTCKLDRPETCFDESLRIHHDDDEPMQIHDNTINKIDKLVDDY